MNAPALPVGDDFSSLFEFLPIGAYRSLPNGRQLRGNPALVRLNGYDTEAQMLAAVQDIGLEWYVNPGRRDDFRALLEREGRVVGFESEVRRHKTGERIWVSENAHMVRGAGGEPLFYEGTVEEITDRVRAREALRASEQQLHQIIELVPGMIYRVIVYPDGQRRSTFVSPSVRELYGVEPAAALGNAMLLRSMRHPDDQLRVEAAAAAAAASGEPLDVEYRIVLANGQQKWVHAFSAPAPPDAGGQQARVGVTFDISDRKRAEQALRENSEVWKRALESSGDGVWDWDLQTGIESFSPQLLVLYGYEPGELADDPRALDDITHPDDVPAMLLAREEHFSGRAPVYVNEHRMRCKDGQWKWILSRGIVISRDAEGRALRVVGTHTDITADKQAAALRVERDRAAAANLAKSQFLSRVSHELRTPLNAILGFAQLLELDLGPSAAQQRQQGWVRQVLSSGRHLLALMDDILDLSSVQTGQLPVQAEPVPLRPVLDEALAMVTGAAQDAQVRLIDAWAAGSDAAESLIARADRKRLKQIISNLLSNAVKYNRHQGWVRVNARALDQGVELVVADGGQGMDETQLARLFQPFERLGAQRGPVEGTGLGLALSRQLAEAMGGSIAVDSTPGQGSTFRLWLPAAD